MPSSLRKALVGCAAAIALAAWGAALPGCAQEGKTPTCVNNVTADGMQTVVFDENDELVRRDDLCNPFGKCLVGGDHRPAAACCVDEDGEPMTGGRLVNCVYGFGGCILDGEVHPSADCCVDEEGQPLEDAELKACLLDFGEDP